jgi:hypothetical protein
MRPGQDMGGGTVWCMSTAAGSVACLKPDLHGEALPFHFTPGSETAYHTLQQPFSHMHGGTPARIKRHMACTISQHMNVRKHGRIPSQAQHYVLPEPQAVQSCTATARAAPNTMDMAH